MERGVFFLSIPLLLIILFPFVFAQERVYSPFPAEDDVFSNSNSALTYETSNFSTIEQDIPKFRGYIIEFKEEPILKEKTRLEQIVLRLVIGDKN